MSPDMDRVPGSAVRMRVSMKLAMALPKPGPYESEATPTAMSPPASEAEAKTSSRPGYAGRLSDTDWKPGPPNAVHAPGTLTGPVHKVAVAAYAAASDGRMRTVSNEEKTDDAINHD